MNRSKFIYPACAIFLTGCSSLPSISSKDAGNFISEISAPSVSQSNKVEEWLQPENKKEACLLIFKAENGQKWWGNPSERILWDGECRDGYAYGLGREFYEGDHGLIAVLSEYRGGRRAPTDYSATKYDSNEFYFGEKVGLLFKVQQSSPISYLHVLYRVKDNGVSYDVATDISGNRYVGKTFSSGYRVAFSEFADPAAPLRSKVVTLKDGAQVNYVIDNYRNGAVDHVDINGVPKLVRLPKVYLDFLSEVYREVLVSVQESEKSIKDAEIAINRYKRRACEGDVDFQGVDSKIYGQICLPIGEPGQYADEINRVRGEIRERYEAIALSQKTAAENLATQNAAIQNKNIQNLNGQLQGFSSSMQGFSNSMFNYNMQNNNKMMPGGGVFGTDGNGAYETNCYQAGNIISCKSR